MCRPDANLDQVGDLCGSRLVCAGAPPGLCPAACAMALACRHHQEHVPLGPLSQHDAPLLLHPLSCGESGGWRLTSYLPSCRAPWPSTSSSRLAGSTSSSPAATMLGTRQALKPPLLLEFCISCPSSLALPPSYGGLICSMHMNTSTCRSRCTQRTGSLAVCLHTRAWAHASWLLLLSC